MSLRSFSGPPSLPASPLPQPGPAAAPDPQVGEFAVDMQDWDQHAQSPEPVAPVSLLPEPLSWDDIAQGPKDIDFVFPGLPLGSVGMIAAPGSTGKSFLLLSLAVSVATGTSIFPGWALNHAQANKPAKVLMFFGEDPPDILHNRLYALLQSPWVQASSRRAALIKDNLEVRSMVGRPTALTERNRAREWMRSDIAKEISEYMLEHTPRLVCIDPLRQFHTMDENDSGDMTQLIQNLQTMAHDAQSTLIFNHHTNKNATTSGQGDIQQAARGSSALTDNVRWQANMMTMSEEEALACGMESFERKQYVRMALSKANYTSSLHDIWFKREEGGILFPTDDVLIPPQPLSGGKRTSKTKNKTAPTPSKSSEGSYQDISLVATPAKSSASTTFASASEEDI